MSTKKISFKSGYKYQIVENYLIDTGIIPPSKIKTSYIELSDTGEMLIKKGYAWDGTSGPVVDSSNNLRASLIHDAFYQLLRNDLLDRDIYRKPADLLFKKMCIKDGVPPFLAGSYYRALRAFGKKASKAEEVKEIQYAP